jgi:steroid 5-alpha reductase family enzyme
VSAVELIALGLAAAVAVSAVMLVAWVVQQQSGNSGWVDTIWTFGTGAVAVAASLSPLPAAVASAATVPWRQWLVAALAAAWSARLGWHIARRSHSAGDDPRYRDMARQWGAAAPRRMFFFLQAQAAVSVVLVLSVALAARNPAPNWRAQDLIGALLLAIAIGGEALADGQLRRFKSDPAHRGKICDAGLWAWSRHPNYFFEWMGWLAYPVIAIDGLNPWGWLSITAPALMYWILVHVSGIPPLEQHMSRTRGADFEAYKAKTRAFLPLPRRRASA